MGRHLQCQVVRAVRLLLRWFPLFILFLPLLARASEVYFSPDGGIRDQLIKRINTSRSSIDLAMYSFTSGDLAEALANAAHRGVRIRVIRDASQSINNKNDENTSLEQNGIHVAIRTGRARGIMHNKLAIFDGKEVFTGSYNWTTNAERNNWENALFTDEPKIVESYQREFEKLWNAPLPQQMGSSKHSRRPHRPLRFTF